MAEERLLDSWSWCTEDITREQEKVVRMLERDLEDSVFWKRLLALKERHIILLEKMLEAQEQQAIMLARAEEATVEDCQVLDTILTWYHLLPRPQPWPCLPPGSHLLQASQWTWAEVKQYFQRLWVPTAAPTWIPQQLSPSTRAHPPLTQAPCGP
ncbi:hypothetical protein Y1Q_0009177 [Alligator mississippiensis]|uniref:Uncharacterized protein n=1 Tax=Alligator mississippiensis TaxID=8496 RepID=A0A151M2J3_ALLMI|nr:hypothetical protein Y1Q_0009177 [Alligator mississippiensis]